MDYRLTDSIVAWYATQDDVNPTVAALAREVRQRRADDHLVIEMGKRLDAYDALRPTCLRCEGVGTILTIPPPPKDAYERRCPDCDGTGKVPLGAYIKLLIEAGDDLAEAAEALYQGYPPQITEAYNAWRAIPRAAE